GRGRRGDRQAADGGAPRAHRGRVAAAFRRLGLHVGNADRARLCRCAHGAARGRLERSHTADRGTQHFSAEVRRASMAATPVEVWTGTSSKSGPTISIPPLCRHRARAIRNTRCCCGSGVLAAIRSPPLRVERCVALRLPHPRAVGAASPPRLRSSFTKRHRDTEKGKTIYCKSFSVSSVSLCVFAPRTPLPQKRNPSQPLYFLEPH